MRLRAPSLTHRGFSLIELMIALTLGLLIIGGVGALSLSTTRSYRALSQASQQIENGRYALSVLMGDLEHAGFLGQLAPSLAGITLPRVLPDPCLTTAPLLQNLADNLLLPITGTCGASLNGKLPNTPVLTLMRANSTGVVPAAITAGNTYIQTTPAQYILGTACSTNLICGALKSNRAGVTSLSLQQPNGNPADLRQLHVHVYYLRAYSSQSGDNIPTLMRKSPADQDSNAQPIVEGIENMQIQYGIDDNGDGAPERYTIKPSSLVDWSNVVTVRIHLLARSIDADFSSPADTRSYALGNLAVTPGGHYRRHVFSGVARIVNLSARREQ